MVSSKTERRARTPGPLRLAFTQAIQDWYYGLIPLAVINLLWLVSVITVVAGPPATAAMLAVARDAVAGQTDDPGHFFTYLRRFFWRAWGLGLITFLGSVILVTDMFYYAGLMSGNAILANTGVFFLLYVLIVWIEFLLLAWPLLVDRPNMPILDVMRNAAILTLRRPGANFGLALIVIVLYVLSFTLAVILALAFAAIVALMVQHYLHIQAPQLANFPPSPGEDAVQAESELW